MSSIKDEPLFPLDNVKIEFLDNPDQNISKMEESLLSMAEKILGQISVQQMILIKAKCSEGSKSANSFATNVCILFHELLVEIGALITQSCEPDLMEEAEDAIYLSPEVVQSIYGVKEEKSIRLKPTNNPLKSAYESMTGNRTNVGPTEEMPKAPKRPKRSKKSSKNSQSGRADGSLSPNEMGHLIECPTCKQQVQSGVGRHRCANDKNVENPCQCPKCSKIYGNVRVVNIHLSGSDGNRCPGYQEPEWLLREGRRPDTKFICVHPDCLVTRPTYNMIRCFQKHVLENHEGHPEFSHFKCTEAPDSCQRSFPYRSVLKLHIIREHKIPIYVCQYCGANFKSSKGKKTHEMSHTGERPHSCTVCGKAFKTAAMMREHAYRAHSKDPEAHKKHQCSICGKKFWTRKNLEEHNDTQHNNIKQFTCPICGRALKNDSCYRRHMTCVHNEKFSCSICQFGSSTQKGLELHKIHEHNIFT